MQMAGRRKLKIWKGVKKMKKLTRKEILAMFKEEVLPYIKEQYSCFGPRLYLWRSSGGYCQSKGGAAGGRRPPGVGPGAFC